MPLPPLAFRHVVIDPDNPPDPHCKELGDLTGDGRPDLLAASASGGGLWWYRNPGWSKHRIAEGSFTTDMAVGDIDGDGCLDVVVPGDAGMLLYRNPRGRGGDPSGPWEAVNLGADGARMHDVELGDLDRDGRLDVVTRHQSGFGKMMGNAVHLWFQNSPTDWQHVSFPCPHGEGLCVADVDGDGWLDVVIGGRWYRNPQARGSTWSEHLYVPADAFDQGWTRGDTVVAVGDLDMDGRNEIVIAPAEGSGRLSWFAPPADPRDGGWTENVVEAHLDHAHGLALAAMDGDGHLDIVVAKMHQATPPQDVAIYRNLGAAAAWQREVVASHGSHNIRVADIDGDGRPDIYGANWNNGAPAGAATEVWLNLGGGAP
ncbi:MAG: VCBS repeat-containing protein [Armatimonadetes bacterium]|nr:VCBS repeat-containing protein [Armatimonadota bacterium]